MGGPRKSEWLGGRVTPEILGFMHFLAHNIYFCVKGCKVSFVEHHDVICVPLSVEHLSARRHQEAAAQRVVRV
jgi:hypothetical protein